MENFPSYSYPDSGDSSPRSREIDFENPPPSWEDQQQQLNTSKVKFMVSYNGKIQPRTHDNILSYVGGETKILAVDRSIKFSSLLSKLSSILTHDSSFNNDAVSGFTFKYQLPGEELDALISVTNDDDLDNMMHEYDRLYRGSSKPARLRVFLFPVYKSGSFGSTCSDKIERDSDRDRFVDALNSVVSPAPPPLNNISSSSNNNNNSSSNNNHVDFLFGLDKGVQIPVQVPDPQIDARIQELNRMQISDPNLFVGAPANIPPSVQIPANYWQQPPPPQPPMSIEQPPHHVPPQHIPQQFQQPPQQHHQQPQPQQQQHHQQPQPQQQQQQQHQQQPQQQQQQQPVYMVHAPPLQYHAPMMRPGQGYYQMQQRVQGEQQVYREQPVYGKIGGYSEGMGLPVRQVTGMSAENTTNNNNNGGGPGYGQVAYDSGSGRQVYYGAPPPGNTGVVTTPFQGVAVGGSGEMRVPTGVVGGADPTKVVQKVAPTTTPV